MPVSDALASTLLLPYFSFPLPLIHQKTMRHHLLTFLLLLFPLTLPASVQPTVEQADSAFLAGNYEAAASLYSAAIDSLRKAGATPSSDIYYNLGNALYRQNIYPAAVLSYLRALRVDPGNSDAAGNLDIVRSRLTDHFTPPSEMFFISWMRDTIRSRSVEQWTGYSLWFIMGFFIFTALYLFARRMALRKTGFTLSALALLACILAVGFACMQRYSYHHNLQAVLFDAEAKVYTSPTANSQSFLTIHEGCTLLVGEETATKGWIHITLPDEREGWMRDKGYRRVAE